MHVAGGAAGARRGGGAEAAQGRRGGAGAARGLCLGGVGPARSVTRVAERRVTDVTRGARIGWPGAAGGVHARRASAATMALTTARRPGSVGAALVKGRFTFTRARRAAVRLLRRWW